MTANTPSVSKGAPFEQVGSDLFQFGGHQHLLVVDRFSGYPLVKKLKRTNTMTIINVMSEWFNMLGWPRTMRSDGGPQFRG